MGALSLEKVFVSSTCARWKTEHTVETPAVSIQSDGGGILGLFLKRENITLRLHAVLAFWPVSGEVFRYSLCQFILYSLRIFDCRFLVFSFNPRRLLPLRRLLATAAPFIGKIQHNENVTAFVR